MRNTVRGNSRRKLIQAAAVEMLDSRVLFTVAGEPDPGFNGGRFVLNDFGLDSVEILRVQPGANNTSYVLFIGSVNEVGAERVGYIARFNSGGSQDTLFGGSGGGGLLEVAPGTVDQNPAVDFAVNSNGDLRVATQTSSAGTQDIRISGYTASGTVQTSFGLQGGSTTLGLFGTQTLERVYVEPSTDRVLVVGATNEDTNGGDDGFIARFDGTGAPDINFDSDGHAAYDFQFGANTTSPGGNDRITSLDFASNGIDYIIGGAIGTLNTTEIKPFVGRVDGGSGSLDSTFGSGGIYTDNSQPSFAVTKLAVSASGKIITILGLPTSPQSGAFGFQLNSTGSIDTAFVNPTTAGVIADVKYTADQSIITLSTAVVPEGAGFSVQKFTSTGADDTTFSPAGSPGQYIKVMDGTSFILATSAALDANGSILAVGEFSGTNGTTTNGLAFIRILGAPNNLSGLPDIRPESITTDNSSETASPGDVINVSAQIANISGIQASGVVVRFVLSTSPSFETSSFLRDVTISLNGFEQQAVNTTVTIPAETSTGLYYLGVIVNPANSIPEESVANNQNLPLGRFVFVQSSSSNPDIQFHAATFSTSTFTIGNNPVVVTASFFNSGIGTTVPTTYQVFITDLANPESGAFLVGTGTIPALIGGLGEPTPGSDVMLDINSSIASGTYFITVVADPNNLVEEDNESNNLLTLDGTLTIQGGTVEGPVDLQFTNLSVVGGNFIFGDRVSVNGSITNIGTGTSPASLVFVYLSATAVFGEGASYLVGVTTIRSLAPGDNDTGGEQFPLPAGLPVGSYYVVGVVDPLGIIDETSESNNQFVTATASVVVPTASFGTKAGAIGTLDVSFGQGGIASTVVQGPSFEAVGIATQPDGKIVAVGSASAGQFVVIRYNPDGSFDTTFGTNGVRRIAIPGGTASAISLQPDGRILVAGSTRATTGANADFALVRLNPDGSLDTTFALGGVGVYDIGLVRGVAGDDEAGDVTIDNKGRVYLAGTSSVAGVGDFAVVRINADGSLDTTFGTGGVAVVDFFSGNDLLAEVTVDSKDGDIILAGTVGNGTGQQVAGVARLDTKGLLDKKFATGGKYVLPLQSGGQDGFTALNLDAKRNLVLAGFSRTASGTSTVLAVRLTGAGKIDTKFATGGVANVSVPGASIASATRIIADADGRLVISAQTSTTLAPTESTRGSVIIRLTATGALDTTFAGTGILQLFGPSDGGVNPARLPDDGLAGQFNDLISAAQGIVDVNPGGGILAIATSTGQNDTTVVQLAQVVASGADLIGSVTAKLPTAVVGGAKGQAKVRVQNVGTSLASGKTGLQLYLSRDGVLDTTDVGLPASSVSIKLASGKLKDFTIKFVFPTDLPDGLYTVLARINSTGGINEINDANNAASGVAPLTVAAPFSDLKLTFGSLPASFLASKSGSVSITVTNNGNVESKGSPVLQLLQSLDRSVDVSDVVLAQSTAKVALKPGKSKVYKLTFGQDRVSGSFTLAATLAGVVVPPEQNTADDTIFSDGAITFEAAAVTGGTVG